MSEMYVKTSEEKVNSIMFKSENYYIE